MKIAVLAFVQTGVLSLIQSFIWLLESWAETSREPVQPVSHGSKIQHQSRALPWWIFTQSMFQTCFEKQHIASKSTMKQLDCHISEVFDILIPGRSLWQMDRNLFWGFQSATGNKGSSFCESVAFSYYEGFFLAKQSILGQASRFLNSLRQVTLMLHIPIFHLIWDSLCIEINT